VSARLGVLTIGQSPRTDVVPVLAGALTGVEIVEAGALDARSDAEIAALAPAPGEYVLVTRLRDGHEVVISRERVLPHVEEALARLAPAVEVVLFLCTGEFPPLQSDRPLIEPSRVLRHVVAGIAEGRRLGILVPIAGQVPEAERRWQAVGPVAAARAVSPYRAADFPGAAAALAAARAEVIVMDCMGYTPAQKRQVVNAARLPTILAGTTVAGVAREFLVPAGKL
jgi:protein AroM